VWRGALYLWKKWTERTASDPLIFDVDGVLIDTRDSFVHATAETVRWCWAHVLGGDGLAPDCEGYTLDYFNRCKTYPAFNDDVFVAWTLLRCMKRTGRRNMREAFPSLKAWEDELRAFDPDAAAEAGFRGEKYSL
jgi:phosphoglycolate phosphatase-like HAD superfamily hydrolase